MGWFGPFMKGFPDVPAIWLLATMLVSFLLGLLPGPSVGALSAAVGAVLIVASLILIGWSALWFKRKHTSIEPHDQPKALIVEGPYRLSRNPIYLALLAIALGYALRQDAIWAFLPVAGLFWVLDRRFASVEETRLRQAFGPEADAYIAQTRRWM